MIERAEVERVIEEMLGSVSGIEGWGDAIQGLSAGNLCRVEDELDRRSVRFAQMAAYVAARGANGCGDSGHEYAMKEMQKRREKVRKALGYNG